MIYCSYCGKELNDDAVFCSACGKKVSVPGKESVASTEIDSAFSVLQDQLRLILHKFPEPDQKILKLRFGLEDGYSRTLAELCECLDITMDDIRKVEANALALLKKSV